MRRVGRLTSHRDCNPIVAIFSRSPFPIDDRDGCGIDLRSWLLLHGMVFMRCSADHHAIALVGSAASPSPNSELHDIAIEMATVDEVMGARDYLRAHQVPIDFEGRRRAGCPVAIEFRDPDEHRLEIYWGLDQIGSDGRIRPPGEWREVSSLEAAIDDPPAGQDTTWRDPSWRRR